MSSLVYSPCNCDTNICNNVYFIRGFDIVWSDQDTRVKALALGLEIVINRDLEKK